MPHSRPASFTEATCMDSTIHHRAQLDLTLWAVGLGGPSLTLAAGPLDDGSAS